MTFQEKDLENIKKRVLSFLKKLDGELQSQLGDLKIAICKFSGLKIKKLNIKDHWSVTIEVKGEDGAQSMLHIMELFTQNPDLKVRITPTNQDGCYVLSGQDPEVVTLWLRSILNDRLGAKDRVLH
jgi:hypothetical protein